MVRGGKEKHGLKEDMEGLEVGKSSKNGGKSRGKSWLRVSSKLTKEFVHSTMWLLSDKEENRIKNYKRNVGLRVLRGEWFNRLRGGIILVGFLIELINQIFSFLFNSFYCLIFCWFYLGFFKPENIFSSWTNRAILSGRFRSSLVGNIEGGSEGVQIR